MTGVWRVQRVMTGVWRIQRVMTGVWRVSVLQNGHQQAEICTEEDDQNYSSVEDFTIPGET